jgi:hypothetical protein
LISVSAQFRPPKFEWGVNPGILLYEGDLTRSQFGSWPTKKISWAFGATRLISRAFSIRAQLLFSKLEGNDALERWPEFRQQRNFYFRSPLTEANINFELNPFGSNYRETGLLPYVFGGLGLAYFKVKRDWSALNTDYFSEIPEFWDGLARDSAHQTPSFRLIIPIGAGIKYFFHPQWGINAETSFRTTGTDLMDGFSLSANPHEQDHYIGYTIGLIYRNTDMGNFRCAQLHY